MKQITKNQFQTNDESPMAAWLKDHPIKNAPSRSDIVEGNVVAKTRGGFFVSIGIKSDAFVSEDECCEGLSVGDQNVRFLVIGVPESDEEFQLSQKKVAIVEQRNTAWANLTTLVESKTTATAHVTKVTHSKKTGNMAGVEAIIDGIHAFIPRRQLMFFGDASQLENTDIPVKVIKADRTEGRFGEVILSHAQAVAEQQRDYLGTLNRGDKVVGKVSRILNNEVGALVDLGLTVGLVHREELSDKRSLKTADIVAVGQELTFAVLRVNLDKLEVHLSLKAVQQEEILSSINKDDIVSGVVSSTAAWGVFVRLGNCIDGLVHESELLHTDGGNAEVFANGTAIQVRVLAINPTTKRISLTRKGLTSTQS